MSPLTETLKVRVDEELLRALEERAGELHRPTSSLARLYIAEGLARDADRANGSRRV